MDKVIVNKVLKERYDFTPRPINPRVDKDVMELIGDDINDYVCVEAKVKGKNRICYRNYVNVKKGIIIAASNYRTWDDEEMPDSPSVPNSEILLHTCKKAVAEREGKPVEEVVLSNENFNLTKIIGSNIANNEALATINLFVPKDSERTFNQEAEGYYAVLGMRVCEGKLFLLEHHFSDLEITAFEIVRKTTGEQVDILGDVVVGSTGERVNIIYHIGKK